MTFTVYGFRLKGSMELRYVGQTKHTPELRLGHYRSIGKGVAHPYPVAGWAVENGDAVETVVIHQCETREEALRLEGDLIKGLLAIGHRLLNLHVEGVYTMKRAA